MRSCRILIAVSFLALLVTAFQSQAQPPGRPDRGQMRPGEHSGQPSPPWLAILDTDSDGDLSSDEIKNASFSLRKLDRNRDGRLTVDELLPAGGGPLRQGPQGQFGGPGGPGGPGWARGSGVGRGPFGGRGPGGPGGRSPGGGPGAGGGGRGGDPAQADAAFARQIMTLDTNQDGLIAVSELPEHMHAAFQASDADNNATLDHNELLVLASHFRREKINPDGDIEMKNEPSRGAAPRRPR